MNLGKRRLNNDELVSCFEELGYTGAAAFLASGNVVINTRQKAEALEKKLEPGLERLLSYPVPTFVRTEKQLRDIAAANPFAKRGTQQGKVQVAFLKTAPTATKKMAALALDCEDDWLAIDGQVLFWWPCGGLSKSELDMKALEKVLGPMTIRTHGTIVRLVDKLLSD
jgi:uncharacterized protein (DUF1697 family)